MNLKLILKENKLLNEVKAEDVIATLNIENKKLVNFIVQNIMNEEARQLYLNNPQEYFSRPDNLISFSIKLMRSHLEVALPNDLEPNQKGQAAIWIKNQFLRSKHDFNKYVDPGGKSGNNVVDWNLRAMRNTVERFYQMNRFIDQNYRDIHRNENLDSLLHFIEKARPAYEAYKEKQSSKDAEAGTEKLNPISLYQEEQHYDVFIANNKGASCQLGKGTDWCTAAPGLEYFKQYYRPEDPLFIFISQENPTTKFQFHYGTKQFMDKSDYPINDMAIKDFSEAMVMANPTLMQRYPIIQKFLLSSFGLREMPDNFPWVDKDGNIVGQAKARFSNET